MPAAIDYGKLSARERDIFELATEGLTDAQIADRLNITQSTVNSYWVRIRGKLGQLSRTELVAQSLKESARIQLAAVREQLDTLQESLRQNHVAIKPGDTAEFYHGALGAVPEALVVVDAAGVVRFANRRLELMFGYGPDELIGRPAEILAPKSIRERVRNALQSLSANPQPLRLGLSNVVYGQRRDGSLFRATFLIDFQPTPAGPVFTCIVRDFAIEINERRITASGWVHRTDALL